jgi:hypothetical protein
MLSAGVLSWLATTSGSFDNHRTGPKSKASAVVTNVSNITPQLGVPSGFVPANPTDRSGLRNIDRQISIPIDRAHQRRAQAIDLGTRANHTER